VTVSVSDTTKGWVQGPYDDFFKNGTTLYFYPGAGGPQTLLIQGKDDHVSRDDAPYTVILSATSGDSRFNGVTATIGVTNVDRTDSNACVPDVQCAFFSLGSHGTRLYADATNMPGEYFYTFPTGNHFEGIARLKNDPYIALTGTGESDSHLFIVKLPEEQNLHGCFAANNPPGPGNGIVNYPSDYIIDPLRNYTHAGGLSILGDFAAIPLEASDSTVWPQTRVAFFDLSHPQTPALLNAQILRPEYTHAGAAGMAKFQDGRYLVAVQSDCPAEIQFYISDGTPITQNPVFTKTYAFSTSNYPESFPACGDPFFYGRIQNVNLIQECGSAGLYMIVTWNTSYIPEGTNEARLYSIQPAVAGDWTGPLFIYGVGTKSFPDDDFYHWLAAGGSYVTEDGQLAMYGSNPNRCLGSPPTCGILPMYQFCALESPAGVTASPGTYPDRVRVTWSPVAGASSYRVLRNGISLGTTTTTSFDDTTMPICGTFAYTVKAEDCGGQASAPSTAVNGWTSSTPADGVPAAPVIRTPADGAVVSPANITFDWDGVCLAQTYLIEKATTSTFAAGTIISSRTYPSTQTVDFESLPPEGHYYWHVRGNTAAGAPGHWSATRSIYTYSLGLVSPAGGESWTAGSSQTVTWIGTGPVNIDLSADAGATWRTIVPATTLQSQPITVPGDWSTIQALLRIVRTSGPAASAQTPSFLRILPAQHYPWLVTALDTGPSVTGEFASLGIDPWGRTSIGYFDRTAADLKFASRYPPGWSALTIVADPDSTGWYPSIAFGSDGQPRVSYVDSTLATVRYARRVGGDWQVDPGVPVGCTQKTSLGIDTQDELYIAFSCGYYIQLLLKANDSYGGAPFWTDASPLVGGYYVGGTNPVIRMQGDLPRIAYVTSNGRIGYAWAWWNPAWPYMAWSTEEVAGTDGATYPSLVLDAQDNPSIAFYASGTKNLRLATKSSTWSVTTVDGSAGDVGRGCSIALDPSGRPRLSYQANGLLKHAAWDGAEWLYDVPDAAGTAGIWTSIGVDGAGNSRIAYFDQQNGDLKYAISTPDVTAPAAPVLQGFAGHTTAGVGWRAPGDDGTGGGPAWSYDASWSQQPIDEGSFERATPIPTGQPGMPGAGECVSIEGLDPCSPYYFAVRVFDDAGNVSWISSPVTVVTKCGGPSIEVICP
jgi:hypothetical protein